MSLAKVDNRLSVIPRDVRVRHKVSDRLQSELSSLGPRLLAWSSPHDRPWRQRPNQPQNLWTETCEEMSNSRRFASTAAHTARFLWGLSREICQKVDVVWFGKLQSFCWSSQLGDNNVHLEATAVDLGGKLTSGKPSLAILWVMLKLSRAMVGHVEAICQILFGHVVGFVPKVLSPRNTKILSGFWRAMF